MRTLLLTGFCIFLAENLAVGNTITLSKTHPAPAFIENKGQVIDQNDRPNPSVLYLLHHAGFNVQLRREGFSYDIYRLRYETNTDSSGFNQGSEKGIRPLSNTLIHPARQIDFHRIDFDLQGMNRNFTVEKEGQSADYLNYYTTGTPVQGAISVHSYTSVIYRNIYPDIDLEFISDKEMGYKSNFIIHPGGKLSSIRIKISGAFEIRDTSGGLLIKNSIQDILEAIPQSYMEINGHRQEVRSSFRRIKGNIYGISADRPVPENAILVIDPWPKRLWGTYYGGDSQSQTANDETTNCTINKDGDLIIAGFTGAYNNIATIGSYQSSKNDNEDAYLAKFTPDGMRLWGTYYGGENVEWPSYCKTDNAGNIFLFSSTESTKCIATPGAFQPALDSCTDTFLVKFTPDGFRIWATYYGGHLGDHAYSLALDNHCNLYLSGITSSINNMASPGAHQLTFGGGECDAFLAKFDSTGHRIWSTYYGGDSSDYGYYCYADSNGHLLLAGNTFSTNNIASPGAFQTTYSGDSSFFNMGDGFIALFDTAGQRQWGTYYGGGGGDCIRWCQLSGSGKIYFAGASGSHSGISTPGAYQPALPGNNANAIIVKFNLDGTRIWGTYYGTIYGEGVGNPWTGGGGDYDPRGAVFICGLAASNTGFASPDAYQTNSGGLADAFLARFDTNGQRVWCTYYGGESSDYCITCVTDTNDRQYIVGYTHSDTGIASPGSHQPNHAGGVWDGFVAKLTDCLNPVPGPISGPDNVCQTSSGIVYSIPAIPKVNTYAWAVPSGATIVSGQNTPSITVDFSSSASPGNISVYAINHCGIGDTALLFVTPHSRPAPSLTGDDSICRGTSSVYTTQHGMSNYQWSYSPGATVVSGGSPSDSLVTLFWMTTGSQWIRINYTDMNNCNALNPFQFNLLVYPGPELTNDTLSKSICSGDSTRIHLTSNQSGTTFSWTASGSSAYVSGFSSGSGNYINQKLITTNTVADTVIYTITPSGSGCLGMTVNDTMIVNPFYPVSISITPSENPVCSGNSVTYTAAPVNPGTSPVYQWKVNGGNAGTNSPAFNYIPVNGDVVICILTSSIPECITNNPATSNAVTMTVNQSYTVGVSIAPSENPVCSGASVTFTATPVNPGSNPSYQWKVNGINVGTNNPVYSYIPVNGDVVVCVLNSSLATCVINNPATSNQILMTVNPNNPVSVTISASDTIVCSGATVSFTADPVNQGTSPVYQWKVNGGNVGTNSPVYSYAPANGDVVVCILTSSLTTCVTNNPATSNQVHMTVNPVYTVGITITSSANPACSGTSVTFTANPINQGTLPVYQWKVNGLNAGTNSPVYSYAPANGDVVICVLTSSFTCTINNPATSNQIQMSITSSPSVTFTSCFDTITILSAQPFQLKGGVPLGGTYSGSGVNSSTGYFNPSSAGIGVKIITYSYQNMYSCLDSKTRTITVLANPNFSCGQTLTDIRDGKTYSTVQLGSQCWMRKNLNYGSFISGSNHQQDNCIIEKYCYNDNPANCSVYGGLYQWDELMSYQTTAGAQGLCPPGWHVPTQNEWNILFSFYQQQSLAGKFLQDSIISGFNAKEAGVIYSNATWKFNGFASIFWTSTPYSPIKALSHGMNLINYGVSDYYANRSNAFAVRCLKDN